MVQTVGDPGGSGRVVKRKSFEDGSGVMRVRSGGRGYRVARGNSTAQEKAIGRPKRSFSGPRRASAPMKAVGRSKMVGGRRASPLKGAKAGSRISRMKLRSSAIKQTAAKPNRGGIKSGPNMQHQMGAVSPLKRR